MIYSSYCFRVFGINTSSALDFIYSSLNITFFISFLFPSPFSPTPSISWNIFCPSSTILVCSEADKIYPCSFDILLFTFIELFLPLSLKMVIKNSIPNIIRRVKNLFFPLLASTFFYSALLNYYSCCLSLSFYLIIFSVSSLSFLLFSSSSWIWIFLRSLEICADILFLFFFISAWIYSFTSTPSTLSANT